MKTPLPAIQVGPIAKELCARLEPFCERLQIAGSLRRLSPVASDIEIVMIPKVVEIGSDLFGNTTEARNELLAELARMKEAGEIEDRLDVNGLPAFGERYQRIRYRKIAVDLFSVLPPAEWGVILLLRTGPADFNKRLVQPIANGGLLPLGFTMSGGRLLDCGRPISTPEEEDVFKVLRLDYIAPERRR